MRKARLLLALVVPLSLTISCGPDSQSSCVVLGGNKAVKGSTAANPPFNLGFEVWKLLRSAAAAEPHCGPAKAAVFDKRKDEIIQALNTTIPADDLKAISEGMKSIFPLVDDGTLPGMTEDIAGIIERLYSDPADPDKKTLEAFVKLTHARNRVIDMNDLVSFLGRFLRQPEIEELTLAMAQIIRENDGVDDAGKPNSEPDLIADSLKFISARMGEFQLPTNLPSAAPLIAELLAPVSVPAGVDLGPPAWAVRLDAQGNPRVAVDPATGRLYAPFTDQNGDGVADVNALGEPIDSDGEPIHIAAFGDEGPRDGARRALAYDGKPLYAYFDSKKTAFAMMLMLVGDLMGQNAHLDLRPMVNAMLGARVTNDNGTPGDPSDDYQGFSAAANPLLDMHWGMSELMKYPDAPKLLKAMSQLMEQNPASGEKMLISAGKAWKALNDASFLQNAEDWNNVLDMGDKFGPLLDTIFEKPNTMSPSTARALLKIYADMGVAGENFPAQLALMMKYKKLKKVVPGDPNSAVDLANSIPVDFTSPMYVGTIDNRSAMEQGVFLFVAVDGPPLPLVGKSIAQLAFEGVANMTPQSSAQLLTFVLGAAGLPVIDWMAIGALNLLGYDGEEVFKNLQGLQALAESGALDAVIPLAKEFVRRGQIPLLLEIFRAMAEDLKKDLDADPATYSVIRKSEPVMIELFSGTMPKDMHAMLVSLLDVNVGGTTTAADVLMDMMAHIVDDDAPVLRRDGTAVSSRMKLLLEPMRAMVNRIQQAGAFDKFDHFVGVLITLVSETTAAPDGTPKLVRPGLVSMATALAGYSQQLLDVSDADRVKLIDDQKKYVRDLVVSRSFSKFMMLWDALDASPSSAQLYQGMRKLFVPNPQVSDDVFGALVRILAQLLQKGVDMDASGRLMSYLAKVLDPDNGYVVGLVQGSAKIIETDLTTTTLGIMQNAFWQGEDGTQTAPVNVFLALMDDLRMIEGETCLTGPEAPAITVAEVESLLRQIVFFMRDDATNGLPKIYAIIKERKK